MSDPPADKKAKSGLGYATTALFLITQMAGAGFLSLPRATANTGGCVGVSWCGLVWAGVGGGGLGVYKCVFVVSVVIYVFCID